MTREELLEAERQTLAAIIERKTAFQLTFGSPAGEKVLDDFDRFCRGSRSCFDPDPRVHAVLEGRREVWLRIREHLDRTPEQLFELYTGRPLSKGDTADE